MDDFAPDCYQYVLFGGRKGIFAPEWSQLWIFRGRGASFVPECKWYI